MIITDVQFEKSDFPDFVTISNALWEVHWENEAPHDLKVWGRSAPIKLMKGEKDGQKYHYAFVELFGRRFITQNTQKKDNKGKLTAPAARIEKVANKGGELRITYIAKKGQNIKGSIESQRTLLGWADEVHIDHKLVWEQKREEEKAAS